MIMNAAIGRFIKKRIKKEDTDIIEDETEEMDTIDASNNNSKEAE